MDAAGNSIKHDALVILLFDERESLAVRTQTREFVEEGLLGHIEKVRDCWDFIVLQSHISGPLAASGAALADVENIRFERDLAIAWTAVIFRGINHLADDSINSLCRETSAISLLDVRYPAGNEGNFC